MASVRLSQVNEKNSNKNEIQVPSLLSLEYDANYKHIEIDRLLHTKKTFNQVKKLSQKK